MKYFKYVVGLVLAVALAACGGGGGNPGTSPGGGNPGTSPGNPSTSPSTALFTTAPDTLTVGVGSAQEFTIGGGRSPYTAASNNAAIVIAGIKNSQVTLGGVTAGTAQVSIRDADGASVIVNMIVSSGPVRQLFTTATSNITIAPGVSGAQTYSIGGGAGPYTATSSNASIASVALTGDILKVTGITAGSTNIVIMDTLGAIVSVAVTVPTVSNLALFTTAPSSVTVAIGASPAYSVGGGTAPYTGTSDNANVATVNLAGISLTVTGVAVGSANIVVRDSAGSTVSVKVIVGTIPLAVTPSKATGIINDVLIATITGGTPPYRASVGNVLVASALIQNQNELKITLLQVGETTVTVLDANNQSTAYSLTSNAATPGIRLSPGAVTVSEFGAEPILFTVYGAAPGAMNVFSSDVTRLSATLVGQTVTVTTGTTGNRCVTGPGDTLVTITIVDSTRASGVAIVTIRDNGGTCP